MKAITCMIISLMAAIPSLAEPNTQLSPEEAIARMECYGLIRPTDNEGRTYGVELRWHVNKLRNGDEEINEFPWLSEILTRGDAQNRVPVSCIKPFVEAGATLVGDGERTPLSVAAYYANWKAMRYLIETGADVNEKYDGKLLLDVKEGILAKSYRLSKEAEATILFLLDQGYRATEKELEELATIPDTHNVIKRMIKAGVPVTYTSADNALKSLNAKGVALLFELGHIVPMAEGAEDESVPSTGLYPSTIAEYIESHIGPGKALRYQEEILLTEMLALPCIKNNTDGATIHDALSLQANSCSNEFRSHICDLFPLDEEDEMEDEEAEDEEAEE